MSICVHALVVDDRLWNPDACRFDLWRCCLLCGVTYDRTEFLQRLQERIRSRYRLGAMPWLMERP